jgi:hypothetical protein
MFINYIPDLHSHDSLHHAKIKTVSRYFPQALFAIPCFLNSFLCQNFVKFVRVCYLYKINPINFQLLLFWFPHPQPSRKSLIAPQKAQSHKGQYRLYIVLYNTLLNSDHLIGCLWSRDIEWEIPFPKSAMEYVPLHSLRLQLYYTFYSIALLCVIDKSNASKCFSYESISLFCYYIKQIINVYECNGKNIFFLVKDGMFHSTRLSPCWMEYSIFHLMKIFLPLHS